MPCTEKSVRRNGVRSAEEKAAQRARARGLRQVLHAREHWNRREVARLCGARVDVDPSRGGDFGDDTGCVVSPRSSLRLPEEHGAEVAAFYARVARG